MEHAQVICVIQIGATRPACPARSSLLCVAHGGADPGGDVARQLAVALGGGLPEGLDLGVQGGGLGGVVPVQALAVLQYMDRQSKENV